MNCITYPRCLLVLALLLSYSVALGEELDLEEIGRLVEETLNDHRGVGLSVGILHEGEVVMARGFGIRSFEREEPVTPETLFAIGSVTKQFTCATVLLLEEDGKLSFADRVGEYFPDLARAADITLLDLAQHVAGYPDYYPLDFVTPVMQEPTTAEAIIADYATGSLDFEPGTRWSYSNTGYLILGEIVERAGGRRVGDFLRTRIFEPLGLQNTKYEPAEDDPGLAVGYNAYALGQPEHISPEGAGWAGAAGGIWSTPTDLLAWDLSLMDGEFLSPDSYRTLTTPRRLPDGRSTGYGCGLGVRDRLDGLVLTHGGAVEGFVARNTFVPATRSAVVLLANASYLYPKLGELSDKILESLMPSPPDVPEVDGPAALDAAAAFIRKLRAGEVDRTQLGEDFNAFLTDERMRAAAAALKRFGKPKQLELAKIRERGGMEVSTIRLKLGRREARAVMYRTPDGKIQELMIE
jgi:CubicO group peptidase (beta-lactamase class C family)